MANQLPKVGQSYRIWKVVEDLVLEHYDQISDVRMRGSYYLLRDIWLEELRGAGEITDAEFDYFADQYEYYRDNKWPEWEKRHGIRRPETKPPTIVIEDGSEFTEAHLDEAWSRSRGFIFVEKSGMAEDLTLLSHHGWLIVAAQGESTRTFREYAANDGTDRPILAITDADYYGGGIEETLMGYSERTEHLGLWRDLDSRVQVIGLTTADADALDLPRERDPTKSPDEWRTELDGLVVLTERMGIENPLLPYTVARMDIIDVPLCPLPVDDPDETVRVDLSNSIRSALSDSIDRVVDSVLEGEDVESDVRSEGTGPLMQLMTRGGDDVDIDLSDLNDELEQVARDRYRSLFWRRQSRYEELVRTRAGNDDVDRITDILGGV